MRFLTATFHSGTGGIHPVDEALASHPKVTRQQLLHVNSLFNEYGVLLYCLEGGPDAVDDMLDVHDHVVDYDVLDTTDTEFHIYIYVRPGQPAGELMHLAEKYGLIVDTPLEFMADGGLRVTIVGQQLMIQQALREMPASVDLTIQQAGRYTPEHATLLSTLTSRQRRVLELAVELGYYETPRKATQSDIADALDCATSTVDEHLRKVESHILTHLVR